MNLDIIVVDDEAPICDWLVYCIRRASPDYRVEALTNAEAACARILEKKPDVVFTDIRMPGMDGLTMMHRVLDVFPFTNFVILTNYADFSYAKEAISLGAKQYYLKSKLRAADLEALLEELAQKKQSVIADVVHQDRFLSGMIDLYSFYRDVATPEQAAEFCLSHGMKEDQPYSVVCVRNRYTKEDWSRLVHIAEEIRNQSQGSVFAELASEKEYVYMILQTEQGMEEQLNRLCLQFPGQAIGISSVERACGKFPEVLHQSACALEASFFSQEPEVVYFSLLRGRKAADRNRIKTQKREIMELLEQHRYADALQQLEAWFEALECPNAEDMEYLRERCLRMVISVEERLSNQLDDGGHQVPSFPVSVPSVDLPKSFAMCRERCRELLERMRRLRFGQCSASIETALQFIHRHYRENISLMQVAQHIYRSPEYFSRQFKEEVGENFSTYLTLCRLRQATTLLESTDLSVARIAEEVGYSTPGYFSRLYKKYYGQTPDRVRSARKLKKMSKK